MRVLSSYTDIINSPHRHMQVKKPGTGLHRFPLQDKKAPVSPDITELQVLPSQHFLFSGIFFYYLYNPVCFLPALGLRQNKKAFGGKLFHGRLYLFRF